MLNGNEHTLFYAVQCIKIVAITNTARVRLARPLRVPKAIPIERWWVGVTRICSATSIAVKSVTPHHNSHDCGR